MSLTPKVTVREIDETLVSETQTSKYPFFAGLFEKGPCYEPTFVYSAQDLYEKFGLPSKINYNEWYQCYNFFQYQTKCLLVTRCVGENSYNSYVSLPYKTPKKRFYNLEDFELNKTIDANNIIQIYASSPGNWGNKIKVAIFTQAEIVKKSNILDNYYAHKIKNVLLDGQYCVCVFYDNRLVEQFVVKYDEVDNINGNSDYIFIINNFKDYKYYDGNIFWVDGNEILADGNLPNELKAVFYGSSILELSEGSSEEPSPNDIHEAYEDVIDGDEFNISFLISNERNLNAAYQLSSKTKIISVVNIPKDIEPLDFYNFTNENVIIYSNYKKQFDKESGKYRWVAFTGDIVGLKTYLMENVGLNESYCKLTHLIQNVDDVYKKYNEVDVEALLLRNINVIQKTDIGTYLRTENLKTPSNIIKDLTNVVILRELEEQCEGIALRYVFEQNDEYTRYNFKMQINQVCEYFKSYNLITDFKVVCDLTNNVQFENILNCDILYKPIYLTKFVNINVRARVEI